MASLLRLERDRKRKRGCVTLPMSTIVVMYQSRDCGLEHLPPVFEFMIKTTKTNRT